LNQNFSLIPVRPAAPRRLEIPTVGVAMAIYGGFFALTWFFHDLPLLVTAPLGSLLLAWHGSLQHETIHGHPTPWRYVNTLIGSPPLSLWIPYEVYRDTHLRHHRHAGRRLTDPRHDTESFYLPPGTLADAGCVRRAIHSAHCTLAGRLLLGPALAIHGLWIRELRKLCSGNRRHLSAWSRHALGVTLVLAWTRGICHIPLLVYTGLIVYPGMSLTLLRSFAEHRAHPNPKLRTTVVEAGPLWALILLNNNLHIAHHAKPKLPWYELPRAWRQMRASVLGSALVDAGVVWQDGYFGVSRRFLFRPVISAEHPVFGNVAE
jgi:fatty acid desaturase